MDAVHHAGRDSAVERRGGRLNGASMRARAARKALFVALALCAVLSACVAKRPPHGSVIATKSLGVETIADVERQAAGLFEMLPVPQFAFAVESWILRFTSTDFDGTPVEVLSQLFVPRIPGGGERPVLVFGSGTTGLADGCAPSLEQPEVRRLGYYTANMLAYAARGFIVVFPDYIGFNDPARPQRYFSKLAEAHVMLDGARAARAFLESAGHPVRSAPRVFTAGYSQGGHAAFAAADLRKEYAPEVPLAGVVGFGATCDVTALLRDGPVYAPFIMFSYSLMYGGADVNPALLLQQRWASTLAADADRLCVDEFQVYYPSDATRLYRTDFRQALNDNRLDLSYPRLAARLEENRSGLSGHGLPALIIQGNEDIVATTATQDRFVAALRQAGSPVRYLAFDGIRHRYTRPAGFEASVEWMELIARGDPAPSDGRVPN